MADTFDARAFQARLQRLGDLLRDVEQIPNPAARACTREIAQAILDLHEVGLSRLLSHLTAAGAAGAAILDTCARDDVVGGLLLLHGLHPLDLETRVLQALDQVRPRLRAHGGNVELLGIVDGAVRLRLVGNCHGCPSSSLTMKQSIEEAILEKAPDAIAIEVEGAVEDPSVTSDGQVLVVLSMP